MREGNQNALDFLKLVLVFVVVSIYLKSPVSDELMGDWRK